MNPVYQQYLFPHFGGLESIRYSGRQFPVLEHCFENTGGTAQYAHKLCVPSNTAVYATLSSIIRMTPFLTRFCQFRIFSSLTPKLSVLEYNICDFNWRGRSYYFTQLTYISSNSSYVINYNSALSQKSRFTSLTLCISNKSSEAFATKVTLLEYFNFVLKIYFNRFNLLS